MNINVFNTFPVLESERLLFRQFELTDAIALYQIRSNCKLMSLTGSYIVSSLGEALDLIKSFQESFEKKRSIEWAIVEKYSSKVIGYFCLYKIIKGSGSAEICYALNPKYWGRGFMIETINRINKFAFHDLEVKCLEAEVEATNKRSINALERAGFKRQIYFDESLLYTTESINNPVYFLFDKDYYLQEEEHHNV